MTIYAMLQDSVGQSRTNGPPTTTVVFGFIDASGNFINLLPNGSPSFTVELVNDAPHSSAALNRLIVDQIVVQLNNAFTLNVTAQDVVLFGGAL